MIEKDDFSNFNNPVDSFELEHYLPNVSACQLPLKSITKKKALRLHNFTQLKKQFMFHT